MFENKNIRFIFFGALLLALTAYFLGLGVDVTRDAGKYATVSKEIFQNGNVINLTVHGDAYDQKPPMTFWLGALGFVFGEVSNFWFKLPIFLLILAGFYWAYRLGESLYNKRVGMLTAGMLFFSLIYGLYSMDIHTDTILQAFVILALWQLWQFIKTRKNKHWIIGFTAIGLAMLSKGPVGAAIPAFAVLGHIVLTRDFKFLLDYRWYAGVVLAFLVASPALIGLWNQFGFEGIRFFFWDNNIGRITGSYVQATNDPIFYVHTLLYLFLPWSLLFFVAASAEFSALVKNRFRNVELYTFSGIWVYFIILNAADSQLPNYVFSIVPLIAVLTAKWIDIAIRERHQLMVWMLRIQFVVVFLLWALLVLVIFYLFPNPSWYFYFMAGIGLGASLKLFYAKPSNTDKLLLPSVIVFAVLLFVVNAHVLPYMFSYQAPPKAGRYFTHEAAPGEKLYNYNYTQYELFFYSEPQALQIDSDEEAKAVAGIPGNWVFTDEEGFNKLQKLNLPSDTIISYRHLYLNRPARFFNPKNRDEALFPMYLIKY